MTTTSVVDPKWIADSNATTLYHLERQGRTAPGVVPFIGAGLSVAFGLKDWKSLLLSASPPHVLLQIKRLLRGGRYEEAAEKLLRELTADGFQNMVAASAGDSNIDSLDYRDGTVSLLPLLSKGPVITTNFDRVLEHAFAASGASFESVISGPRPDLIVDALHGNRRVLIKLHGDWQDRVGRTFAKSDYNTNYGKSQPERKRELLSRAEELIFSGRSLLFIGASLGPDRTVEVLERVHSAYAGVRHFAVMNVPGTKAAFHQKERHLRRLGVLPLWYRANTPGDHVGQVQSLVTTIVERVSVQRIATPMRPKPRPPAVATTTDALRPSVAGAMSAHFERVTRLIEDGHLLFFLGSAIHAPTQLMAKGFYQYLAQLFECEALGEERFAVAQYISDRYGRDNLYAEIRKLFARNQLLSRDTHELFAAWKSFKTNDGQPLPYPTILTTNYDDVLERRLDSARLPYHLLSYQASGPHRGRFFHRTPDKTLSLIEQPQNIRRLEDAFIVVKMNGGLDSRGQIPESYATTRLDYWHLAASIPDVLPQVIRRQLSSNPLLFLGHGLAAADIESLVRFAHKEHHGPRSWAVVLNSTGVEYWRQCGVEILGVSVNEYVNALRARLAGVPPKASGAGAASRRLTTASAGSAPRAEQSFVRLQHAGSTPRASARTERRRAP